MDISWSVTSQEAYLRIIEQLFNKWNIKIVEKFELEVNSLLKKIAQHNHICPESLFENLHKCVINKHISLIYRVKKEASIEIVTFVFNESDHIFQ